jgi:hypothetical protein
MALALRVARLRQKGSLIGRSKEEKITYKEGDFEENKLVIMKPLSAEKTRYSYK